MSARVYDGRQPSADSDFECEIKRGDSLIEARKWKVKKYLVLI